MLKFVNWIVLGIQKFFEFFRKAQKSFFFQINILKSPVEGGPLSFEHKLLTDSHISYSKLKTNSKVPNSSKGSTFITSSLEVNLVYGNATLSEWKCGDCLDISLINFSFNFSQCCKLLHVLFIQYDWLWVPEHINFKLALLVFCCLHGVGQALLMLELHCVAELKGQQHLRSTSTAALIVPLCSICQLWVIVLFLLQWHEYGTVYHHLFSGPHQLKHSNFA